MPPTTELSLGEVLARNQRRMLHLEDEARDEFMRAFHSVRRKLRDRLDRLPDEGFTAAHFRTMLGQVEQAVQVLQGELGQVLVNGTRVVGNTAVEHAAREIALFEEKFQGIIQPIDLDRAQILARAESTLLSQYTMSINTYGMDLINKTRQVLMEGLLSGEFTSRISREISMLGGVLQKEQYRAERIVRTELNNAYNTHHQESYVQAKRDLFPDMKKKWLAMLDDRTGDDSIRLTGQVREVEEFFVDPGSGRRFLHPPERPNSRCRIIPWRDEWKGDLNAR